MRRRARLQDSGKRPGHWENCVRLVSKERTNVEPSSSQGDGFLLESRRRLGELILPDGKKCFENTTRAAQEPLSYRNAFGGSGALMVVPAALHGGADGVRKDDA